MIPEDKCAAVTRALQGAFGVTAFEDIRTLPAGLSSALRFRIVVRGAPYLLRIITRTDPMSDPARQFACMKAAADARLSPHVWYTSVEDRISITDCFPERSLLRPGGCRQLRVHQRRRGEVYLREYFGHPPDEYQLARFFLIRQVMHMLYAAFFVLLGASGEPVNQSEELPSFRDFHRRIWAGEVDLAQNDMKTVYGRLHWNQLLQNAQRPRFDEAPGIVSERHARSDVRQLLPVAP